MFLVRTEVEFGDGGVGVEDELVVGKRGHGDVAREMRIVGFCRWIRDVSPLGCVFPVHLGAGLGEEHAAGARDLGDADGERTADDCVGVVFDVAGNRHDGGEPGFERFECLPVLA